MSTHIGAKVGDIAKIVLLPGDPLRARFIAENYLKSPSCYSEVRGMLGYTGEYKGVKVSVQGTGMGQPSMSIYATELMKDYGCQILIRVGTIGAIQESIKIGDVIIAVAATTDSAINTKRFGTLHYSPIADFKLLRKADKIAATRGLRYTVGQVASDDLFYDDSGTSALLAQYGVLGLEMETAELYTLAAKYHRQALAIMTVSDHILTGEVTTSEEREKTFTTMMTLALDTAVGVS